MMEPRRIDDQIRDYYRGHRLSDDARARMKAALRTGAVETNGSRWWWTRVAIAAVLLISVTAIALWFAVLRGPAPASPQELASIVVQTAAVGHNEQQELEFRVSRTAALREAMKSLDFTPVEPEMMAKMNMRVVGARYTTIEGVMAAQILYVGPNGEPCTLYELRPVQKLARIPSGEHDVDGLRVSVWREKGLLMVLARPVA